MLDDLLQTSNDLNLVRPDIEKIYLRRFHPFPHRHFEYEDATPLPKVHPAGQLPCFQDKSVKL